MRKFPDWKQYSEVEQWERELAATRVRVRMADGTEESLSGALECSTLWLPWHDGPADAHALGEHPGSHMSGAARLGYYPAGSRVQIHREDAGRTAYVVEVVENLDPVDLTGDPCWDRSLWHEPTTIHPDLLAGDHG